MDPLILTNELSVGRLPSERKGYVNYKRWACSTYILEQIEW